MSPINPMKLMKIKDAWMQFASNHPKFPMFMNAVSAQNAIKPDAVIEINITTPDGQQLSTNIKVKDDDMELLNIIKDMA